MSNGIPSFLRLLTKGLGSGHPIRLLCGVSFGLFVKIVISVLLKVYPENPVWMALNEYPAVWYVLVIAPLLFIPVVFGREGALEAAILQINTLKLLITEGGFSETQERLIWRSVVERYVNGIQPDLSRSPSLTELSKNALDEVKSERRS